MPSYDNLREDFIINGNEKEYRHAYGEESTDISVGTQIKVLREQRGWRQEDLAREAGIQQPMVSRYENVNYSNWTLSTLKKLARAYDVWLDIRFRSFGELVDETNRFSRKALQVTKFADDPFFKTQHKVLRPKIRKTTQNTGQLISFNTGQPIVLRNLSRPTTGTMTSSASSNQLPLQLDLLGGAEVRPQLVNVVRQQQETTSFSNQALKAAAGAGGNYVRQANG